MSKAFKHFKLITKHRYEVFKLCFRCGIIWRGLVHDLSKYSFVEFFEGAKYYKGEYSPIVECRKQNGYSRAWIHHKNKNKHHIEYWYDKDNEVQINMPYKYAVECICDKIAASKCYNKNSYKPEKVLEHWLKWGTLAPTNDKMRNFYTKVFTDLVEYGEKYVLNKKYLKKNYQKIVINS